MTFIEKTLQFSHSLLIVKYNKAVVLYCTPETKLKTFSIELLNFFIKLEIKEVGSWPELHTNYLSKKSLEDRTPIKSSLRYMLCSVLRGINKKKRIIETLFCAVIPFFLKSGLLFIKHGRGGPVNCS